MELVSNATASANLRFCTNAMNIAVVIGIATGEFFPNYFVRIRLNFVKHLRNGKIFVLCNWHNFNAKNPMN